MVTKENQRFLLVYEVMNDIVNVISESKAVSFLTGRDTDFRKWSVEWPTNV
jgi:hypothetical protein